MILSVLTNRLLYPFPLAGLFLRKLIRRLFKLFPDGDTAGFGFIQHLPRVFRKAGGNRIRLPSLEKQQIFVRPGFIKGIVHIPLPGHPVKSLRVSGKFNAVCTVVLNGIEYYRTRVEDSDGNRVALYAKTPEKLYDKELEALEQIDSTTFRRRSPTVAEYCEKWLLMQSVHVRATTLTDYTSKVRRHIIGGLGDKRMADVSLDDIQLALVPVSKKSASVYKSVVILCKSIFRAAKESHVIDEDPTIYLDAKGGVPQEERQALTDEQVERLLDTIRDLPPYVFVMIGLYAGLRREEILALQWDSVYLDAEAPYLTVRRAWHTEHNRPVILTELKTKAAQRNIPLPVCLVECLKDAKKKSTSDYVIANRDGDPLSYTQFKRLWQYIVTRTAKPRMARKLVDGKYVKYMLYPKLGEKARNNGHVVYSLDFEVTPHQLRHTYITNLIHSSVDPKTVQYLAGHESSKITMDIYAKVKYNRPDDLVKAMGCAFDLWDAV